MKDSFFLGAIFLLCACTNNGDQEGSGPKSGPYLSDGLSRPELNNVRVLDAMARVPRHRFVPEEYRNRAYDDSPLSIGKGQTISQPFVVALMSQEAEVGPGSRVLEVGTGSGFQAAVLAELGATVYSIEIIPELAKRAEKVLRELKYDDIRLKVGDGWKGWPEHAPFDAILVTAAAPSVPPPLLEQLANYGRLIIPVEKTDREGENLLIIKKVDSSFHTRNLGSVRFVPLVGEARK